MDIVRKPLASDTLRTRLRTDGGRGDTPLFGPFTVYAASKGMIFSPSVVRNRVSILALWFQTEPYGFCNLGLELSMVFWWSSVTIRLSFAWTREPIMYRLVWNRVFNWSAKCFLTLIYARILNVKRRYLLRRSQVYISLSPNINWRKMNLRDRKPPGLSRNRLQGFEFLVRP